VTLTAKYKVFKDEALNMPGFQQVTGSSDAPTNFGSTTSPGC